MIELTLPAMSCAHCVRTVTETVQGLDAQAQLSFDLAQHRVTIESAVPAERIAAALADEGYPAATDLL